jgi:hypothetical protein
MTDWPHDDTSALTAFYGDPSHPHWPIDNLVTFTPPWQMSYKDDNGHITPITKFQVHAKTLEAMNAVFSDIWAYYGKSQDVINAINMQWYGGCFNYRPIRGSSRLSCHAFAAAIDLDPEHNPMNRSQISHMPPVVIAAFKKQGAFWGGDFHSRQDPMHFQWAHE